MAFRTRWYDRNPLIFDAMSTWHGFPPVLQRVLAAYIKELIEKRQMTFRLLGSVKDLFRYSRHKLLIWHMSRRKRRWYDWDSGVQATVNTLALLRYDDVLSISECILHLHVYLKRLSIPADTMAEQDLRNIVDQVFSKHYVRFF